MRFASNLGRFAGTAVSVRQPQVEFVFGGVTFACEVCLYVRRRPAKKSDLFLAKWLVRLPFDRKVLGSISTPSVGNWKMIKFFFTFS